MCLVNVVVPLYKGKQYIENIITMLENNAKKIEDSVELILVNDEPEECIGDYKSPYINITLLNNDCNKGIHFSRVNGLKYARGEYVLFLDQDDQIADTYIKSQLEHVTAADAVVCNGTNNGKMIYDSVKNQQCVKDLKVMIQGNKIVSPGQVLIKRTAIPEEWIQNILVHNYSDDYFLWLLMLCQGKKIMINQEVLYNHVYTGNNASLDRNKMYKSVSELIDYFEKWDYLSKEQITQIRKRSYELSGKYFTYSKMLDMWMQIMEEGNSIENILLSRGYRNVAVYGMGILGKHLIRQLKESQVEVKYVIDRNKYVASDGIEIVTAGDEMQDIDVIIITPVNEYEEIKIILEQFYLGDIISLESLLR